jgi:hypothetical protein
MAKIVIWSHCAAARLLSGEVLRGSSGKGKRIRFSFCLLQCDQIANCFRRLGDCLPTLAILNLHKHPTFLGYSFSQKMFSIELDQLGTGLHFRLLFHRNIWSPCSRWREFRGNDVKQNVAATTSKKNHLTTTFTTQEIFLQRNKKRFSPSLGYKWIAVTHARVSSLFWKLQM